MALVGLYFLVLAGVALFKSSQANRFLLGFASSLPKHLLEMLIRIVVGGAFVLYAPQMALSEVFLWFGWIMIASSTALLLIPWTLHRRFANYWVPKLIRHIKLIGVISFGLGGFVLYALIWGGAG